MPAVPGAGTCADSSSSVLRGDWLSAQSVNPLSAPGGSRSDSVSLAFQEICSLLLWESSFRASGSSCSPELHDPRGTVQTWEKPGWTERA